jgi:hypothetical protein
MRQVITLIFLCIVCSSSAQEVSTEIKRKKGTLYLSWGYTRAWFGKSTIHFEDRSNNYHDYTSRNNYYDFTIYNAKAHDRPDFDKLGDVINFTVPQFAWRIGYYLNNKCDLGFEVNFDHTKYIVTDYQTVRIQGQFNGNYVDKDTMLDPNSLLHFEHSDGANFLVFNLVKRFKFFEPCPRFTTGWIVKAGAGMVIPRTDVTLFGERLNNKFHVAGWIAGIETGLRVEFLRYGSFELTAKGSYADYMKVLVLGVGNGKANHSFFTGQLIAQLGFMIGGKK